MFLVLQVPSLPPFRSYLHANYALWLNNGLILDERSPTDISDLTWDEHGCDDQYPLPPSLLPHMLFLRTSIPYRQYLSVNILSMLPQSLL